MILEDPYDWVRIACILTALYCLVQMWRLHVWWSQQEMFVRFMLTYNCFAILVFAHSVAEGLAFNLPGGPRVITIFACLLFGAVGLTLGVRAVGNNHITKE